jgi:hypothetical protein
VYIDESAPSEHSYPQYQQKQGQGRSRSDVDFPFVQPPSPEDKREIDNTLRYTDQFEHFIFYVPSLPFQDNQLTYPALPTMKVPLSFIYLPQIARLQWYRSLLRASCFRTFFRVGCRAVFCWGPWLAVNESAPRLKIRLARNECAKCIDDYLVVGFALKLTDFVLLLLQILVES